MDMNVYVDEDLVTRLDQFNFENGSDNVLEDMKASVEILKGNVAVSGLDEDFVDTGLGANYLTSRMGCYCLEHFNDFLSIVHDENLREGFKSAIMFINEKLDSLTNKETE